MQEGMGVSLECVYLAKNVFLKMLAEATIGILLFSKQAVESIEQVAHLCQSEIEEVRNAARETTLSFGKSCVQLSNIDSEEQHEIGKASGLSGFALCVVQHEHIWDNGNVL